MSYWMHTAIGIGLITIALCAIRQARDLRRLRDSNAARIGAETASERAARRTC